MIADICVLHVLTERNVLRRTVICFSIVKQNDPFLKRIITKDETWVVYKNVKCNRSWSKKDEPAQTTSNVDNYLKKVVMEFQRFRFI